MVMKTLIILIILSTPCYATDGGICFGSGCSASQVTTLPNGAKVLHFGDVEFDYTSHSTVSGQKTTPMEQGWAIIKTPQAEVESNLGFSITDFINERLQNEQVNILDLGCGAGTCADSLATSLRRAGVTNVKIYALSDMYFPTWSIYSSDIIYILDDMENLSKYNITFDLIYGHFSYYHLKREPLIKHLRSIVSILKPSAKIVFNTWDYTPDGLADLHEHFRIDWEFTHSEKAYTLTLKPNGSTVHFGWEFVK